MIYDALRASPLDFLAQKMTGYVSLQTQKHERNMFPFLTLKFVKYWSHTSHMSD